MNENFMMMTYPGLRFLDPFNPDPEQIHIEDIANSLGMLCRYGGHVKNFYSVAEHCVLMADHVFKRENSQSLAFAVLMDDAPEAYLQDLIRPNKIRLAEYRVADNAFGKVIRNKYGIAHGGFLSEVVHQYDFRMLRTEMSQMLGEVFIQMHFPKIAKAEYLDGVELQYWRPHEARLKFTEAFYRYRPEAPAL